MIISHMLELLSLVCLTCSKEMNYHLVQIYLRFFKYQVRKVDHYLIFKMLIIKQFDLKMFYPIHLLAKNLLKPKRLELLTKRKSNKR